MKILTRWSLCALASALLLGCHDVADPNAAHVRLVNATAEFASLDLYEGTNPLGAGVAAHSVGEYSDLKAATYTLNLKDAGAAATAASTSQTLAKATSYTLVAYASGGALTTQVLTDNQASPKSGSASLRVMNTASADAGNVDVYLVGTACSELPDTSASAIATGVSGLSNYTEVATTSSPGGYHVCVTAAGDKADLRLDIPAVKFGDREVTTLVLMRGTGGVLLHGLLLAQGGAATPALNTSARMRLAVGSSGDAAVTATANGVKLGTNLAAPAVTGYQLVPAGPLTMAVTVGGNPAAATALDAPAGADLTLLVTGTSAALPTLLADDNSVSTSSSRPVKLRLVNGMTGTGSTATLTNDFADVGGGAVYGAASKYALVPTSAALAHLQATYGMRTLCDTSGATLLAGAVYSVFLLGDTPATPGTCLVRRDR